MKNELFRKNSLDNISSPEQLNDCIRTSRISVWIVFLSVILLLSGLIIWGFVGMVDIKVSSIVVCEDNFVICYIPEKNIDEISQGTEIIILGNTYTPQNVSKTPFPAKECISPYGLHLANLSDDEWVYAAELDADIEEGIHKAEIVIESISPISLLMD